MTRPAEPEKPPPIHWGLWLAVAGVPLVWTQRVVAEFTLPKLFLLSAGVFISLAALLPRAGRGGARWRGSRLDVPVALGLCASMAAALGSIDLLTSLAGRYNSYGHGLWLLALLAAACLLACQLDRERSLGTLQACVAAAAAVGAHAVMQHFGVEPFQRFVGKLPAGRAVSTLGSPVDLGAYLALLLPPALHLAMRPGPWRPAWAACALAAAGGLFATLSRASWLGAAAGAACYVLLAYGWKLPLRNAKAWALAAAILAGGAFIVARKMKDRPLQLADVTRAEVWRTAWNVFRENPALGTGPDTFEMDFRKSKTDRYLVYLESHRHQAHAHNDVLQALATTGLPGAAAYAFFLVALVLAGRTALKDPDGRGQAAALCGGLLALFVNMKFNPVALEVLTLGAVLSGLLAAAAWDGRERGSLALPAVLGLALAAAASTAWCGKWLLADRHAKLAREAIAEGRLAEATASIERAMRLNPCELSYRMDYVNHLGDRINGTRDVGQRLGFLKAGLESGRQAAACHPRHVNAHYIYGVAALMHAELGFKDRLGLAAEQLDVALTCDPTFIPLLKVRLGVAAMANDAESVERATAQIRRVEALRAQGPKEP